MALRGKCPNLLGTALLGLLASGCAVLALLEEGAPIRAVALQPLLDRPAELIALHGPTPLDEYGDTLSAVLVRFEGPRLSLRTGSLREAPARQGTLREFLGKAVMSRSFQLLEVRGKSGRTLGYVLAREKGLETLFLDENEALVANAMPIKDAFGP